MTEIGAGNETRTRDPDLGKVVLYQLSYSRINFCHSEPKSHLPIPLFPHPPSPRWLALWAERGAYSNAMPDYVKQLRSEFC